MADLQLDTSLPNLQPQLNPVINAPAQPQSHGLFGGLNNVLGRIGDALLIANGAEPIHRQHAIGQMIGNYLGNADPGLAQVFAADPATGLALYKVTHPDKSEFDRELQSAGIDPKSAQGQSLLMNHLNGATQDPAIKEYEYAKSNGYGGSFMDYVQAKQGPLIANNGDGTFTIVPRNMVGGGQPAASPSGEVTATNPKTGQKLRLNPQTNQWEPLGGATGSTPSPTFR